MEDVEGNIARNRSPDIKEPATPSEIDTFRLAVDVSLCVVCETTECLSTAAETK